MIHTLRLAASAVSASPRSDVTSWWPARSRQASTVELLCMGRLHRLRSSGSCAGLDDVTLIGRLDDADAMRELIVRHERPLMSMAMSMIRNRADAEEIVQDTFVQAYRAAGTFRGDAKVSTWLHSICYRQVLTRTRRRRHLTVAIDEALTQMSTSTDDAFRLALDDAVEELPDINRQAFVLVDVLGFSRSDAAEIVGVEANTMRARVAKARALLADILTAEASS